MNSLPKNVKDKVPELQELKEKEKDIDPTIQYILDLFYNIKRSSEPLTYSELKCYCDLMNHNLEAEEVKAIISIDRLYNRYLT